MNTEKLDKIFAISLFGEEIILQKQEYYTNSLRNWPYGSDPQQEIKQFKEKTFLKSNNIKLIEFIIMGKQLSQSQFQEIGETINKCSQLQILVLNLSFNYSSFQLKSNKLASAILQLQNTLKALKLNLANNLLDGYFCKSLVQSIGQCVHLENLDISFRNNNLTEGIFEGFQNISNLKSLKNFNLDFSFNSNIQDSFLQIFSQIFQLESLKIFQLNLRKTNLKTNQVFYIFENIHKLYNLEKIYFILQENAICYNGMITIAQRFQTLNKLIELKLDLGWAQIDDKTCAPLIEGIMGCKSLKILDLDLKWNSIQSIKFSQTLNLQKSIIERINLNFRSSQMSCQCLKDILDFLSQIPFLDDLSLHLQGNPLTGDTQLIGQGISKLKISKLSLNIEESNLNNNDIIYLLQTSSQNNTISQLYIDLRENKFDKTCLNDLAKQLANFKNLRILNYKMQFDIKNFFKAPRLVEINSL
ncbi:hypothetical protein ABPG74_019358 [Tetrahymena malaccensis]